MTTGTAPGQHHEAGPWTESLAAGRYAELPRGSQHPRHPQRPRLPSSSSSLALGSSRPSGHKAGASLWERQRRRNTPGVRQTPDPANRQPQPGPALRGLLTSHGKSCWGVAQEAGSPLGLMPGTPNLQGEPAAVCGDRSCIELLGSFLPVQRLCGSQPWAPRLVVLQLIRPHQHHNTRPWALQHKAGPS